MSRTCSLCGNPVRSFETTCASCKSAMAQTPLDQAEEDARMFGVGFVVDGKRVSPQSVVVVREPKETPREVREALQFIHDTFKADLDRGAKTRDKEFAVSVAAFALGVARPTESFDDFWLREGPSLAWDEDRKRAARRIWDAARKGGA